VLVGAQAFCDRALEDMRQARSRLYVQAMTFESDHAGSRIAVGALRSPAHDRRVLVDDYSRWIINDRLVLAPHNLVDRDLQAEADATRKMFRTLRDSGVGVRVTNPIGFLLSALPFRNHKKLIVADDVAYLGGVNFSDHNFAWRDLMLRIEGAGPADALAADFEATWSGQSRTWRRDFEGLSLIGLDGADNAPTFDDLMTAIDRAGRKICVVSPYLTFPFVNALERAAARGVAVELITPLDNNKPTVRDYLLWAAGRARFQVRLTPDMIHLKGLLIDDETLVLGSSNFDFVSYRSEEELLALVTDAEVIAQFRREVVEPLARQSLPLDAWGGGGFKGRRSLALLRTADLLVRALPGARRLARDWCD
jgi:cardiolipin synthase